MNRRTTGGRLGHTTIQGSDADGPITLQYRPTRTRTAPAPRPTRQSEEGEHPNRHHRETISSPDQLHTSAELRQRRLASLQVPLPPRTQPTGPGSLSAQSPSMSSSPVRRAASANQPPTPRQVAMWSVLGTTGHSDDGTHQHRTQHRTARERYYGLNPSPRRSSFRRAVRRVVTDFAFRLGERIGRRIESALLERNGGERLHQNEDGAGGGGGGGRGARAGRERRGEERHGRTRYDARPMRAVSRATTPDREGSGSVRRRRGDDVSEGVDTRDRHTHRREPPAVSRHRPVADDAQRRNPRRRGGGADRQADGAGGHIRRSHGRRAVTQGATLDAGQRGRAHRRSSDEHEDTQEPTSRPRFNPRRRRRRSTS